MLNRTDHHAASVAYQKLFYSELELHSAKMMDQVNKMATVMTVGDKVVNHRWLGDVPSMKVWEDERQIEWLSSEGFSVTNEDYEATISVHRDDVQYDKLQLVAPRIRALAEEALRKPWLLLIALINAGFTATGYDGATFFSDSHATGDNKATAALALASYEALFVQMLGQTTASGNAMDIRPTHIFFDPALEATVRTIIKASTVSTGGDNIHLNEVEMLPMPGLTSNYWGLCDLSKTMKPFIWQQMPVVNGIEGQGSLINFNMLDDANVHESAFMRKEYIYGVERSGKAAYAFHQLIAASNATT